MRLFVVDCPTSSIYIIKYVCLLEDASLDCGLDYIYALFS